ncbi:MAG: zinc dependent phospholipase C family protein [Candidatus Methanofastidiosia archaeon]
MAKVRGVMKIRVCFLVMMTILVSMPYTTSWGWNTHFFMTREALRFLLEEEREIFSGCEGTLIESSVLPDKWRDEGKDLESNHLYYPEKSGGTAPDAIKKWYLELVSDLAQKDFEEACMDAGVMAHYIEDMSMPMHTGEYTYHHTSYERSVNDRLNRYRIYDFTISYVEDVKAFVISEAKESNSHYQEILNLYDEGN